MSHERVEPEVESLKDAPRWLIWGIAFINRTGFPIVVCAFLAYLVLYKMDDMRKESQETAKSIVSALTGNTNAIGLLTEAVKSLKK